MTTDACPTAAELAAAISRGSSEAIRVHVARCPRCADEWAAAERVVVQFRQVVWDDASPTVIEEQRTALLASAGLARAATSRRWVLWALPAVAAAAIIGLVVGVTGSSRGPVASFHGSVTSRGPVTFEQVSARPDEVVSLTSGTIAIEVTPLARGERFRVVTTDAEVEVRGTAFEVSAARGHLVAVRVSRGRVEVRPAIGAAVVLGAGEVWAPPVIATSVVAAAVGQDAQEHGDAVNPAQPSTPTSVVPPRSSAPHPRTPRRAAPPEPNGSPDAPDTSARVAATAYQDAWSALRMGDHAAAAAAFERAATAAPGGSLTEDAWYWRAVSLARGGQAAAARAAFAAFLEHYRASPRAPQASTMLGWLLFDVGDLDAAAQRFGVAADAAAPTVRDSARKGLDAVRRRRGD